LLPGVERGREKTGQKRTPECSGLLVDFAFGALQKDVPGADFVLLQITVLGAEGKVTVPLLALAKVGDQEAGPGFSFSLEEAHGTATKAVQAGGTPR
jgi:hypothetical protein